MAPVARIHAESTLSAPLCRLAQGQVRVPFSAAAAVQPVALGGCVIAVSGAPSIGRRRQRRQALGVEVSC